MVHLLWHIRATNVLNYKFASFLREDHMSKEIKIGIITILAIAVAIWGFQYMKGKNILGKVQSFKTTYQNIEGLKMAAPVEINGYVVGSVSKIELNPEDVKSMIISFDVQGEWKLPQNTVAVLAADNSLVGSKKIILNYQEACTDNCAVSGSYLAPGERGMLEAMLGVDEIKSYMSTLRTEAGPIIDTLIYKLTDADAQNSISQTMVNMEKSMKNLASMTANMDALLKHSYGNLNKTIDNMAVVTTSLANANNDIEGLVTNLATISKQLVDADLGTTLSKTGETFDNTNALLEELKITAEKANGSLNTMTDLLAKVENGDGTVAKLLNDPEIYNNLENTSKHLGLLLQDLRLNPKRYVRLSVFGRKGNEYMAPDEDPAFDNAPAIKKEN
jgi:phospholipid/cholesterol/gamma-HCH transport system substrate-binding protein